MCCLRRRAVFLIYRFQSLQDMLANHIDNYNRKEVVNLSALKFGFEIENSLKTVRDIQCGVH